VQHERLEDNRGWKGMPGNIQHAMLQIYACTIPMIMAPSLESCQTLYVAWAAPKPFTRFGNA
jgi:hypothetical protein